LSIVKSTKRQHSDNDRGGQSRRWQKNKSGVRNPGDASLMAANAPAASVSAPRIEQPIWKIHP
jgi:hypothetical protein